MDTLDDKHTGLLNAIYEKIANNDNEAIDKLKIDDFYIDYTNDCIVFIKGGAIYELMLQKSYAPAPKNRGL